MRWTPHALGGFVAFLWWVRMTRFLHWQTARQRVRHGLVFERFLLLDSSFECFQNKITHRAFLHSKVHCRLNNVHSHKMVSAPSIIVILVLPSTRLDSDISAESHFCPQLAAHVDNSWILVIGYSEITVMRFHCRPPLFMFSLCLRPEGDPMSSACNF